MLPNPTGQQFGAVKEVALLSLSVFPLADIRLETCFLRYEDEECTLPVAGRHRMDACCCSVGAAWGTEECEECPVRNTPEYDELCPRGPGFATKEITNGKPFFKGTVVSVAKAPLFRPIGCSTNRRITVNIISVPSLDHLRRQSSLSELQTADVPSRMGFLSPPFKTS